MGAEPPEPVAPPPPEPPEEEPEPPALEQTTLLQNEEETFALPPVDASALKGSWAVAGVARPLNTRGHQWGDA